MRIRKDFEELIPPLSPEEFEQLEKNILEEGIRDPLVVWDGTLIDGHNRYKIAQKHHLDYETVERDFYNDEEARAWIIENQFGRRNLSAYDRSVLALKLKPTIAEKAKETQGTRNDICQKSDKSTDTKKELATIAGVSHDTIHKVEKIEEKATPRTKQLLREGKLSINQAYNSVCPKEPDPVKVAKAEHKEFQKTKREAIVNFKDIQRDKVNEEILDSQMVQEVLKIIDTLYKFKLNHSKEDISRLHEAVEPEERVRILGRLSDCEMILREITMEMKRR